MQYRLFMYGSTAATGDDPEIGIVNVAISTNSEREWNGNHATHYMFSFDAASIKGKIENEIKGKCHVTVKKPPKAYEQIPFLYIATSYARAREVLPRLHAIAAENGLALYDAETHRSFFKDIVDDTLITLKLREQEVRNRILEKMRPVWKYQLLSEYENDRDKRSAYIITLAKIQGMTFEERTQQFYDCLKEAIRTGETLEYKDKSFTIAGEWYSISFNLEGYKKHPNMIGFIENDMPKTELLHRMGCVNAFKWMEKCTETEKTDIMKRMNFREMEDRYKNPADRFVRSINITKQQRKELFDIRYSGLGYYGSEFLFHIVPDDYYKDGDTISVLKIGEESASFILPFINDIYPHFYEGYYLAENHLPTEMWKNIVERIKEAKKQILLDTFNPDLAPYIDRFNLFVLSRGREDKDYWDKGDGYRIKHKPAQFLYEHRYEVAHLYDLFIEWSETQLYYFGYDGDDRMFNVQGP